MSALSPAVSIEQLERVAVIRIDYPPVNAIGKDMRVGLNAALYQISENSECGAVLITTAGRTFMAGVDLNDFDGPLQGPTLQAVQARIEGFGIPVVVAMQGLALGGGLELAMACHYRVADRAAKLGLPEITLGIIPGAGGTQRLPRLVGAARALDMILSGAPIDPAEALEIGLIDRLSDGDVVKVALGFCNELIDNGAAPRPTAAHPVASDGFDDDAIATTLKAYARALKGRTTQNLVIAAVKAAVSCSFKQGLAIEADLAQQSLAARESQALRHLFFAERQAGKIPALSACRTAPIARAAVIGAGTMGSGIAISFADAGIDVTLVDNAEAGIARGREIIEANYAAAVKRSRISQAQAEQRIGRVTTSLAIEDVANVDVVVEAVFEDLDLKKAVLSRLDAILPPDKLIATNTSTLSVTELASATNHPQRLAGLHFFSPAHVMKLLEVVKGADTSLEMLGSALQVGRILKKIGVVTGDGFGFIGNRMMLDGYFREAEQLLLEGATPAQVDRAIEGFGFAMGPQRVSDLGGTDVGTKARIQLYKRTTRPDPYFVIADRLTELGRLGQKTGSGFYRYEPGGRDPLEDPEVIALCETLAAERGIVRRVIAAEEIVERCLLALINVGAAVLEEGVAACSADIDVVWTSGYGFPRHLGGPMFHADTLGLVHVANRIRHYHGLYGHYWQPSPLIEQLAAAGSSFAQYDRNRA